jgi:tetratricopeptide (TPR) repeat protein
MKRLFASLLVCALMVAAFPAAAQEGDMVSIYIAPELYDTALTALRAGDFEEGVYQITLFLALNPTVARAYYLRGFGNLQLEAFDDALSDFTRCLDLGSEDDPSLAALVYYLRGGIYAQREAYSAAIADYTESIVNEPSAEAHADRALAAAELEQYATVIADVDQALALDSSRLDLLRARGLAHNQLGDKASGAADYLAFVQSIERTRTDNGSIAPGRTVTIDVRSGFSHTFTVDARSGQRMTALASTESDSADAVIVLLDPSGGALIAVEGEDGSPAYFTNVRLPADGTYTLLVIDLAAEGNAPLTFGIELL